MILLDTDVMVDINREYQLTIEWFASLEEVPALPGIVVLELINGCRDEWHSELPKLFCHEVDP